MKKIFALLFTLLFASSVVWADGYDLTNKQISELAAKTTITSGDLIPVYDTATGDVKVVDASAPPAIAGDSIFRTTLYSLGRINGKSSVSSSSTNLAPSTLPYVLLLKSVGSGGGLDTTPGTTLSNGTPGQVLVLYIKCLMTSGTWVVTPLNSCYISTITLDTQGDFVTLLYVNDAIGWMCLENSGATVTGKTYSF